MRVFGNAAIIAAAGSLAIAQVVYAEPPLKVVYPLQGHETTSDRIFLIGTAPSEGEVTVNGQPIDRSPAGHFAPSFPLQLGENTFTLRHGSQTLTLTVTRISTAPPTPVGIAFAEGTLLPAVNIARQPGDRVCFGAIAPPNAAVAVTLAGQTIPLLPQRSLTDLPANSAVLTSRNEPIAVSTAQSYQGCTILNQVGELGKPEYQLTLNRQTVRQTAPGAIEVLSLNNPQVLEVTAASGTARSGPSTDFSRLTPLPQGTRAAVTGREGEWFRLDYGAWIREREIRVVPNAIPPQTLIRSIRGQKMDGWTEIAFPLQVPVPVSVQQGDRTFTLTLHNTIAQTDTILLNDDPLIERMDWQQSTPTQTQYTFHIKGSQQWGYKLRYEGTTLILSLRHPPFSRSNTAERSRDRPLTGMRILVDAGHGGPEDSGALGPDGTPEKEVALTVSRLLRDRLIERGATVIMTRDADIDIGPNERAAQINQLEPDLALSVHYNALPDNGDAVNTAGVGMFWFHPQSHSLSVFLHNYLVETLDRPSYGIFWNNLALTRPAVAPSVLLELGFMINPTEFEWIANPQEQERLATALADGVVKWMESHDRQSER